MISQQKNIETAKSKSLESYLQSKNFSPIRRGSTKKWVLYPNPLRPDENSNFYVNREENYWVDFARTGKEGKGDVIDLVQEIEGVDFNEAVNKLTNAQAFPSFSAIPKKDTINSSMVVTRTLPLTHPALLSYIQQRALNVAIAKQYLRQLHYKNNGKPFFAVGFRNNKGGWELRNSRVKTLTIAPKWFTTIPGKKKSETVNVFEGWPDFLAVLTDHNLLQLNNDSLILNGVGMLPNVDFSDYETSNAFLDNDKAGRVALSHLQTKFKKVRNLAAEIYPNQKDYNDYLKIKKIDLKGSKTVK